MGQARRIAIEPAAHIVTVVCSSGELARSSEALILKEEGYGPVYYIPRQDIDMAFLVPSDHTSHCPYKGDASYFDLTAGGAPVANVAWTYEQPLASVAQIAGNLAFYPDKCEIKVSS